jgi:uncharacterized membrane protein YqgA involved in biofilm formation
MSYIPLLLGFVLGLLFGKRVKRIDHPAIILISGLLLALLLGALPFYGGLYEGLPFNLSGVYISALIGVIVGSELKEER